MSEGRVIVNNLLGSLKVTLFENRLEIVEIVKGQFGKQVSTILLRNIADVTMPAASIKAAQQTLIIRTNDGREYKLWPVRAAKVREEILAAL